MNPDGTPSGTGGGPPCFHAGMLVVDALDRHPGASDIFVRLGYRCVALGPNDWCVVIEKDSLERAAELHGKGLDELLNALNALPPAPPKDDGAAGPGPSRGT